MGERDRPPADEGKAVLVGERAAHARACNRIRSIQHDDLHPCRGACLHRKAEGRRIGVVPNADVLDVEDERV